MDLFGPLMGPRAKLQANHVLYLEYLVHQLLSWNIDADEWKRRVRAALLLLENGFSSQPHQIAPITYDSMESSVPMQAELSELLKDVRESAETGEPDRRFRPLRELYLFLYERLYSLIIAPFVAASSLLQSHTDLQRLIRKDGRVSPKDVKKLESIRRLPSGFWTEGLNNHLRNSIGHGLYEVLSRDSIRMEDRNPRTGQVTWGPHVFVYRELREHVFQLLVTCEVLIATLTMFDVNHHQLIFERGFAPHTPRRMRPDIVKEIITGLAEPYGFRCEEVVERDPQTLEIRVKVSGERMEEQIEILVGGVGGASRYIEDVRTEDSPIRRQAYSLLKTTLEAHYIYEVVILEVEKEDGNAAGRIIADREARQYIFEEKPIEEVRALLSEDTLPDDTMPVIIRGVPRPV